MPDLANDITDDITHRLKKYLQQLDGYEEPTYLGSGGSAAVYRVNSTAGPRVFKGFNPLFFREDSSAAERRRLEIQRQLIDHKCPSLVQTYRAEEAEGTAFIEMEFISWPSLKNEIANIPDDAVAPLIMQLVDAVRYLESKDVVHRDIKPENIHISPDFKLIKLLDLGVVREFESDNSEDAAVTDHGNSRPFLATAQYSSPEYLFRLDQPSPRLWKGLNFYQVGAVLHDLIMKKPIFNDEMVMKNRWLVARAVLTKTPSFADTNPSRLSSLKSLAARCLAKDIEMRLQLVGWEDFVLEGAQNPISALKGRLAKGSLNIGTQAKASSDARLEFEKSECMNRISAGVRAELVDVCGTHLPFALIPSAPGEIPNFKFIFSTPSAITIECIISFVWSKELYSRTAAIYLKAELASENSNTQFSATTSIAVCTVNISEAEGVAIHSISDKLATIISQGLDLIDTTDEAQSLIGTDLLIDSIQKGL